MATSAAEVVGKVDDPLQLQYLGSLYWPQFVNLVTTHPIQAASTGAIRFTANSDQDRGNCGATFISKHYAVTAAHCVAKNDITLSQTMSVMQYDTTGLDTTAVFNQSLIAGAAWPNYSHATTLTAANGYRVTQMNDCVVKRRCDSSTQFGRDNCPFSATVDIALIQCPSRSNTSYVSVAATDVGNEQVEVWWFHEVDYLATTPTDAVIGPSDNWAHYGHRPSMAGNYHYFGGDQQLLPLLTTTWPDLTPYVELGPKGTNLMSTNVPACHGTSGSGVFHHGDTAVLGTVEDVGSGINWGSDGLNLCTDMNQANTSRTVNNMDYIQRTWTAQIDAVPEVQADL